MAEAQAKAYVRTLVLAGLLGIPVAFAAVLFETVLHHLTRLVWDAAPDALGWSEPAWWYVVLVPAVAGLLVTMAMRLPGDGGHSPLEGLSMDQVRPLNLTSILTAALAGLSLGVVLGPEAPLIALGMALGSVVVRLVGVDDTNAQLLGLAGAFAAISTLFGGPLVASFLLFELAAASGRIPANRLGPALLPGFVAAGVGALVFTGVDSWPGLEHTSLALPSLPDYDTVRVVDLVGCLAVAAVVSVVIVGFRHLAHAVAAHNRLPAWMLRVLAGLGIGALAVAFRAASDRPAELVLFSGQSRLPDVVAEGSTMVLVLLVLAKGLAWSLSLGGGFRGGPVFPSLAIGTAVAVAAADLGIGLHETPAVVTGLAAAWSATLRAPFSAVLMAALLAGSAATAAAPIAVLAATVGWIVAIALPNPEDRSAGNRGQGTSPAEG